MPHLVVVCALVLFLHQALAVWAMPWSQDMVQQPSIRAQDESRPAPSGSIPTRAPRQTRSRSEAGKSLRNPIQASSASVGRGERLYRIHCHVCHGARGQGDGPIVRKFIKPPSLTSERARRYTDGFLYGTIRHGGPKMPSYRDSLTDRERWDVVNYLRSLQGP